ncbi:MAG: glycosyltransferase family 39 protein [Alphaproteobacteria bacterium]|nr:glycosyltransferase family 39 protein [Alphaproteobacteria bacterium]
MRTLERYSYILALLAFFLTSVLLRPLLPIDETRYMTVAWEMFNTKNYFLLSLNYEPYHHKPPMMFWLINFCWLIFGASRWSALIPVYGASAATLVLTGLLARKLYPNNQKIREHASWVLFGTAPFLIYASLVMFDMMLTAVNLAAFLLALSYCEKPEFKKTLLLGLFLGIGVLVKGPVVFLYTLLPLSLYPWWRSQNHRAEPKQLYKALSLALCFSILPVSLWLAPALLQADSHFAYWLVWEQTAGRMKGDFSSSHVRPFYFYLPLLPVLFMPWAFFPAFWKNVKKLAPQDPSFRFLLAATIPVLLFFSLIAGKQPHYLVPLMPFIGVGLSKVMSYSLDIRTIRITSICVLSALILFQLIGHYSFFRNYDLEPIVAYYQGNRDKQFVMVHKYQGEIGFLARMTEHVDNIEQKELRTWFDKNPDGLAIIRRHENEKFSGLTEVFAMPYRSRILSVYRLEQLEKPANDS